MQSNEKILVVVSDIIFKEGKWQGIKRENLNSYLDLIKKNYQFRIRSEVEEDPFWKQIVSYIIFSFKDKYFLYHYLKKAGEQRLKKDWVIGIGGHINPIDIKADKDILEVATMREWREEIHYKGNLIEKKLIGILNDEKRLVDAVHLGLVWHFRGDSPDVFMKEKDVLKGKLVPLKELPKYFKNMGGWPSIVYKEYLSQLYE